MEEEASFPCIKKSATTWFRKQMLSEHRHNVDTIIGTKSFLTNPINERQHRPLCLKQVIRELQHDFISVHKLAMRPSDNNYATSRSLPSISDLRLTEVALQHATAYKQNFKLLKQCNSSSSFESILKEKLNYSRRKWGRYTETRKYNKMWQSLARDVRNQQDSRKREREKVPGSDKTSYNSGQEREQLTAAKHKNKPKENRPTQFSKQRKNSSYTSLRYHSVNQVLPKIILPDWTPIGKKSWYECRKRTHVKAYSVIDFFMTSRVFLGTSGKHGSHFMDMCLSCCHGCRTMKGNMPNHMTRVAREGFS